MTKLRGQNKGVKSLQPVGLLGEVMVKNGKDLGDDSSFGKEHLDGLRSGFSSRGNRGLEFQENFLKYYVGS